MSKAAQLALLSMVGALAALRQPGQDGKVEISSHKIEQPKQCKSEWAKRTQQKMKGKGARKNRGKNRKIKV
jgi:hypothetical protein